MENYSVKATLSAVDKGFTSTMHSAGKATESLGSKLKSGLSFGIFSGIGQRAFDVVTTGASNLVSEIDSSNASWKTFNLNMGMLGKNSGEIDTVRNKLQKFAQQTIYSSSDMATTYSQLAAVGVKNCDKLVTGFGGLAAAAENPQQAMKTLSQQATQMAAKPTVAWQDFKLMLEQTPAGIAAVAKQMGMSTQELVQNVQNGTVKTEDFFNAIVAVGNNDSFTKLATQYKTAGQAMDGLKETLANKLLPAFDLLSNIGIKAIEGVSGALEKIDGEKLATQLQEIITKAQPYWESFKGVAIQVGGALKTIGGFLLDHAGTISKLIPVLLALVAGYKAFSVVKSLVPGVMGFTKGITGLLGKGIGGLSGNLTKVAEGEKQVGQASQSANGSMLETAKAFALLGAGVLMVAGGFALLAYSSIALANAGGLAIGVMAGMVIAVVGLGAGMAFLLKSLAPMSAQLVPVGVAMLALGGAVLLVSAGFALMAHASIQLANAGAGAIACMVGMVAVMALLAVGAVALGPALTAGAVGFIAFGAAILLVGAGALLASASLAVVAAVLPTVASYGLQGATAIAALGASMIVFAAGAFVAGASCIVLGAGLIVLGSGAVVATVGIAAFGAGMLVASAGILVMAASLKMVQSSMKSIASSAKSAKNSLDDMQSSINIVQSGLDALGSKAKNAINSLINAFNNAASTAKSAGQKLGNGFTSGMQSGLAKATTVAITATNAVSATLRSGYATAYSSGAWIGQGFANGMLSMLGTIQSAARQMASAADEAVRAKAKIGSPSRVMAKLGSWVGEGFGNGIYSMIDYVKSATMDMVSIPTVDTPNLSMAYAGEMSSDFDYYRNAQYTIVVPVEVDGKQIAKVTAPYTEEELNKRERRENRKNGRI